MAYSAPGHGHRVNYYSNPAVILPDTGTPTGVAGISNNAAVLTRNRFMMAALGDESASCEPSGGKSCLSLLREPLNYSVTMVTIEILIRFRVWFQWINKETS